jgi:hypothetical protein
MAAPPASTKTSLQQRLSARARDRWPQLAGVDVRFRSGFAYVTARLPDGDTMPLMRLRYGGSASRWGFAIYLASKDGYQDSMLPTGYSAGSPEDALDTACGLYLGDPQPGLKSGSRRESHPPAPTEPYVNLSIHTALVTLITRRWEGRSSRPSARRSAGTVW